MSFSESQSVAIRLVFLVSGALGLAGAVFIIATSVAFRRSLRSFHQRLIFALSLADVGKGLSCVVSVGYFAPGWGLAPTDRGSTPWPSAGLCHAQAIGIQYFELSAFLWPAVIATHLYLVICRRIPPQEVETLMPLYALVAFGLPLSLVLIVAALNALGNGSPSAYISWCWVKAEADYGWIRLVFYYLPMVALWLYNGVLYFLISRQLRKMVSFAHKRVVQKLLLYVLVLILTDAPALINRLQNLISAEPVFALYILHALMVPLQGFGNAVVYGLNARLRHNLRRSCGCTPGEERGLEDETEEGTDPGPEVAESASPSDLSDPSTESHPILAYPRHP